MRASPRVATSTYAPGQSRLSLSARRCIDELRREPFVTRSPIAEAAVRSGDPMRFCVSAPGLTESERGRCFTEASALREVTTYTEASLMLRARLTIARDEAHRAAIRECLERLQEQWRRGPEALPPGPGDVASRER